MAISAHRGLMDAQSALRNRYFRDAVAFGFLIFLPAGIFFYTHWPDWSWLYLVNPAVLGDWATAGVWGAYPLTVLLGFALAAVLVRGDSPRVSLAVPVIALLAEGGVSLFTLDRFFHLSTFEEFAAYAGRPVVSELPWIWTDLTWVATMAGSGVFFGLPLAWIISRNLKAGGTGFLPPVKP